MTKKSLDVQSYEADIRLKNAQAALLEAQTKEILYQLNKIQLENAKVSAYQSQYGPPRNPFSG